MSETQGTPSAAPTPAQTFDSPVDNAIREQIMAKDGNSGNIERDAMGRLKWVGSITEERAEPSAPSGGSRTEFAPESGKFRRVDGAGNVIAEADTPEGLPREEAAEFEGLLNPYPQSDERYERAQADIDGANAAFSDMRLGGFEQQALVDAGAQLAAEFPHVDIDKPEAVISQMHSYYGNADAQAIIESAQKFVARSPQSLARYLDESGAGSHPAMLAMLSVLGEFSKIPSREQAEAEWNKVMRSPEFVAGNRRALARSKVLASLAFGR